MLQNCKCWIGEKNIRKINLEILPRRGKLIDWKNSEGHEVDFIYDDIIGRIKINKYSSSDRKITIEYNNQIATIKVDSFRKCKLCAVFGTKIQIYFYNENNIIVHKNSKIKIIKQIRMNKKNDRGYVYKCCICDYIGKITEGNLRDYKGCPICKNKKVKIGYNDIWTINPRLAKLLLNPNDGYKYTEGSSKKVDWICPDCKSIVRQKPISYVKVKGLSCSKCSDGISIPNKFMYNLLNQINIKFIKETSFKWSQRKIYDFYLQEYNCIIEMQGGLHYKNLKFKDKNLIYQKENDGIKEKLAKENGISYYIQIDARLSELEWIKKSVINSELNSILNLDNVNWEKCFYNSLKSLIIKVGEEWNNDLTITTSELANKLNLNVGTIIKYLKKCNSLGICKYTPSDGNKRSRRSFYKKVICINTNQIFDSIKNAKEWCGLHSGSGISACCRGQRNYAGRNPLSGELLKWKYYEVKND